FIPRHRGPSRGRSISSPGVASPPCAILAEGVSLPSPGAKATTLRCAARPPAPQYSPPQFGQALSCGSAPYLLPKSPPPPQSSVQVAHCCGRSSLLDGGPPRPSRDDGRR